MKHLSLDCARSFALFLAVTGLAGCAGFDAAIPSSSSAPVPMGSIQGTNFGGHAPVVGAHIYVLQAGLTGYGGPATSLLNSSYSDTSYPTKANTNDPKIPTTGIGTPWYYVTTNNLGAFDLSGDYTCTPGLPVYLYGYGGTSAIAPSSAITAYSVTGTTVTLTGYNLLSVGQTVSFSGFPVTSGVAILNTGTYTVTASTLSNFTVTSNLATGSGTVSGALVTPTLTNNPNIVQLLTLGNCPTTGSANFSSLNYVYMNEVSTIATAYALSGFFSNSATALTVTDAVHLSIPDERTGTAPNQSAFSTTPAGLGIENAAANAAVLYNIEGKVSGNSGDGEEHIANSSYAATPNAAVVPQALINTMANALATCVDSNSSTTTSAACTSLFSYVKDTVGAGGVPTSGGNAPVDTATVAIDMAHNPGNSNASTILGLGTGTNNTPYTPVITAADSKDLMIGITWPVPTAEQSGLYTAVTPNDALGSSAVDAGGNIWLGSYQYTANFNTGYILQYDHLGNQLFTKSVAYNPEQIAIDNAGAVWVLPNDLGGSGTKGIHKLSGTNFATDVNYTATTLANPESLAIDATGNVYVSVYQGNEAVKFNSTGVLQCLYNQGTTTSWGSAIDKAGSFWNAAYAEPPRKWLTSNCAAGGGNAASTSGATNFTSPQQAAFDQNGNLWVSDRTAASADPVYKVTSAAVTTKIAAAGGVVNGATALAIDGDNNVIIGTWNADPTNLLTILNNAGTYLTTASGLTGNYTVSGGAAVTPTEGFWLFGMDASGNLWSNGATQLHEYIGIGAPVLTPYAAALALPTPEPAAKP